jgi:hypothetical protein
MLDATVTLFAMTGVVGACSAGLLALPWSAAEVRESVGAWHALGELLKGWVHGLVPRSAAAIPVPVVVAPAR